MGARDAVQNAVFGKNFAKWSIGVVLRCPLVLSPLSGRSWTRHCLLIKICGEQLAAAENFQIVQPISNWVTIFDFSTIAFSSWWICLISSFIFFSIPFDSFRLFLLLVFSPINKLQSRQRKNYVDILLHSWLCILKVRIIGWVVTRYLLSATALKIITWWTLQTHGCR